MNGGKKMRAKKIVVKGIEFNRNGECIAMKGTVESIKVEPLKVDKIVVEDDFWAYPYDPMTGDKLEFSDFSKKVMKWAELRLEYCGG